MESVSSLGRLASLAFTSHGVCSPTAALWLGSTTSFLL